MERLKQKKGITLVALIITVIILLILATVAIREVTGDGIIEKAKGTRNEYYIAQEKEELQVNILKWQMLKNNGEPTLFSFLGEKYGTDNVQLNTNSSITVTVPSGNRYVVTETGEVILLDGTVEEPTPVCMHINTEIRDASDTYSGNTYCKDCGVKIKDGEIIIPDGGVYYVGVTSTKTGDYTGATATYNVGDSFPEVVSTGDVYVYGDYEYRYNQYRQSSTWTTNETQNGWGVDTLSTTKSSYGSILESINGKQITNLNYTFYKCRLTTTAGINIPSSVINMEYTFYYCQFLKEISNDFAIPNGVTTMERTFGYCEELTTLPDGFIPNTVTNMYGTFASCDALTTLPAIPNSVTNMEYTFGDCIALTTIPEGYTIPDSVTNMSKTFYRCTVLTTIPVSLIANSVTNMKSTFYGCTALTTLPTIPNSVTNMDATFSGCTALATIPDDYTIPVSVTDMTRTFYGCTSLTGTIIINASPKSITNTFSSTGQPITITGASSRLSQLAATATNGNVTVE